MKAVLKHQAEIVELLLKAGADPNVKNRVSARVMDIDIIFLNSYSAFVFFSIDCYLLQRGVTALLMGGNAVVVQLLLNNGANVNDIDAVCV